MDQPGPASGSPAELPAPRQAFNDTIAAKELKLLQARREAAGVDGPRLDDGRFAFRYNLTGLALSGGGIRSAAFNLGVVQTLAEKGIFEKVDYLSTVSGGGYLGSMLATHNDPAGKPADPSDRDAKDSYFPASLWSRRFDPRLLEHLRSRSNYLAPTAAMRMWDFVSSAILGLRGLLMHILLAFVLFGLIALPWVAPGAWGDRAIQWLMQGHIILWGIGGFLASILALQMWETVWHIPPGLRDWIHRLLALSLLLPAALYGCAKGYQGMLWLLNSGLSRMLSLNSEESTLSKVILWVLDVVGIYLAAGSPGKPGVANPWRRRLLYALALLAIAGLLAFFYWFYSIGWRTKVFDVTGDLRTVRQQLGWTSMTVLLSSLFLFWYSLIRKGSRIRKALAPRKSWGRWGWEILFLLRGAAFYAAPALALGIVGRFSMMGAAAVGGALLLAISLGWALTRAKREFARSAGQSPRGLHVRFQLIAAAYTLGVLLTSLAVATLLQEAPVWQFWRISRICLVVVYALAVVGMAVTYFLRGNRGVIVFAVVALATFVATLIHPHWGNKTQDGMAYVSLYGLLTSLTLMFCLFMNLNRTSLHAHYRDRLSDLFLDRTRARKPRNAEEREKGLSMAMVDLAEKVKGGFPFPIVQCAVNLPRGVRAGEGEPSHLSAFIGERQGESFFISPAWMGSENTGLVDPGVYARGGQPLELRTAMAISGAAVSSYSLGKFPAFLSALMTLFNIRLGYWLPNPCYLQAEEEERTTGKRLMGHQYLLMEKPCWPVYFLKEVLSSFDSRSYRILLSDGGHFDNLGLYELVRRQCRNVIAIDASADPHLAFADLTETIRRCRVDHGCEIRLDLATLKPDPETGLSQRHVVVGEIEYPGKAQGTLVYIKSSVTGDEPRDVLGYRLQYPEFPHQSTVDQFFDEAQFESYRRLGEHVGHSVFHGDLGERADVSTFFRGLRDTWRAPAQDGGESFVELCRDFMELEADDALREPNLLDVQQYPEIFDSKAVKPKPKTDTEFSRLHLVTRQIQLMENFWVTLKLDERRNREHPDNRGALNLFRRWARSEEFRRIWRVVHSIYGKQFQKFCEEHLFLPRAESPLEKPLFQIVKVPKWDVDGLERCQSILKFDPRVGSLEDEFMALSKQKDLCTVDLWTADLQDIPRPTSIGCAFVLSAHVPKAPPAAAPGPSGPAAELFCFLTDARYHHCGVTGSLLNEVLKAHGHEDLVFLPLWRDAPPDGWDYDQWERAKRSLLPMGFIAGEARAATPGPSVANFVLSIADRAPRSIPARPEIVPFLYLPRRVDPQP